MRAEELLSRLERVKKNGADKWMARCPAHDDKNPSLSISEEADRVLLKCHAGCKTEAVVEALGLAMSNLFHDSEGGGVGIPSISRPTPQHSAPAGCTLEQYSERKRLPAEFLKGLGLSEITRHNAPCVRIPYVTQDGSEASVRFRTALEGDDRFRWKAGSKPFLYGLNRLRMAEERGYVLLVEGESCCHALWHHGYPAVGVPGVSNWREGRDAEHLADIDKIYLIVEPDEGGEKLLRALSESQLRDQTKLVLLDEGDICDIHVEDCDGFKDRLEQLLQAAKPWSDHDRLEQDLTRKESIELCRDLAETTDILGRFSVDLTKAGLVGEDKLAKVLFLAVVSRHLERIVSVAVKGPSSAGKSYAVQTVLRFFKDEAAYALTAMSEKALVYGREPLSHRMLVLYEAGGMSGDVASYLVRSLLSEGRVRYETVVKTSEGLEPLLIDRPGPTGLITTTTAAALHPENETRLLSLSPTDSRAQTAAVMARLASDEHEEVDIEQWHAFDTWITSGEHEVVVPFAEQLATMIPPIAVRLRRDFNTVMSLIKAHALLHQATRDHDDRGRIVATLHDYAAVRELVADLVAEGIEATVSETVRETVEAVPEGGEGISLGVLAKRLEIDKSSASNRWNRAKKAGFLKNLEMGRGRAAKLVRGDPLPEDQQVLPTAAALEQGCWGVGPETEGVKTPPSQGGDVTRFIGEQKSLIPQNSYESAEERDAS